MQMFLPPFPIYNCQFECLCRIHFDNTHRKEFLRSLHQLTFKQCEVILFQILNGDELAFPYKGLIKFQDLETGETIELEGEACREQYLQALEKYNSEIKNFCDQHKIAFETFSTETPFERALAAYFSKREVLF